jgi:hypothetical protein
MTRQAWLITMTCWALLVAGCGGGARATEPAGGNAAAATPGGDPAAVYGELEAGADHSTYTRVNLETFPSPTHGKRHVDVYVNDIALAAYKVEGAAMPVGSVLVKTSWEAPGGVRSNVAGPTFVMVKKTRGFDPENEDWWYAMHWAEVPDQWAERMGAEQIYWRSPSSKVAYCGGCHQNYERHLGMVPESQRWAGGDED